MVEQPQEPKGVRDNLISLTHQQTSVAMNSSMERHPDPQDTEDRLISLCGIRQRLAPCRTGVRRLPTEDEFRI